MPAILAFQVVSGRHAVDDSWKDALDPTLLYIEYSIKLDILFSFDISY